MKKILVFLVGLAAFSQTVFAQGTVFVDNNAVGGWLFLNGNHYTGPVSFEVYVNNGPELSGNLGYFSYGNLASYGYVYQQTLSAIASDGVFSAGVAILPGVTPHATAANLVLVAYVSDARAVGLTEFRVTNLGDNNPIFGPPTIPGDISNMGDLSAMGDLSMCSIAPSDPYPVFIADVPEPSTIALGVMGLSALLFRRRK